MANLNAEIEKKTLKVFNCSHDGKVIFGLSIVVASSKKTAKKMLKSKLQELGLNPVDADITIDELDLTKPEVYVVFDGQY